MDVPHPTDVAEAVHWLNNPTPTQQLTHVFRQKCEAVLASAYLAEHDPTPLSTERLVEMGGVVGKDFAAGHMLLGCKVWVRFSRRIGVIDSLENWRWEFDSYGLGPMSEIPKECTPRTVGELRQLLLRLEATPS